MRVCIVELAGHQEQYQVARTNPVHPETVEALIDAHAALYRLRMTALGTTDMLNGAVANALSYLDAALRPNTSAGMGLYREEFEEIR